eukprot:COSAG02_NODE_579_length_20073_cov_2118.572745_6_plen_126_part_00
MKLQTQIKLTAMTCSHLRIAACLGSTKHVGSGANWFARRSCHDHMARCLCSCQLLRQTTHRKMVHINDSTKHHHEHGRICLTIWTAVTRTSLWTRSFYEWSVARRAEANLTFFDNKDLKWSPDAK